MGSRWLGSIEPGSMPALHRYLGTPVTTWILNLLYGSHFSDIHCGMRGIRTDSLRRMRLQSRSWEYASEMVLKSVHMRLQTTEVPVRFLRDREGRLSHHKRAGWFSPFQAAWINLRSMFIYGADFFLLRPGLVMILLGLLVTVPPHRRPDPDRSAHVLAEQQTARGDGHPSGAPEFLSRLRNPGPQRLHGCRETALASSVRLYADGDDQRSAGRCRSRSGRGPGGDLFLERHGAHVESPRCTWE